MNKNYLVKAINKLKPTAQFSFINGDYSTVKWDILDGDAPTQTQIDAAIKQIKADEIKEVKETATAKSALLEKLGITEDEAKLLLN
jgi:hypothetical protein